MENDKKAYLFHQGTYYKAYEYMGCHMETYMGVKGATFRVWAPNTNNVYVAGDFNNWDYTKNPMKKVTKAGIWELFIPNVDELQKYKFVIKNGNEVLWKADPYAVYSETNGKTASIVYNDFNYKWHDSTYLKEKKNYNPYDSPMNIYEVNFCSWKKQSDGSYYTFDMLANELIPYVKSLGYTHIEVMPITEYPFDGSWGYQVTGYFSVTSRFGKPEGFMHFVDMCHENGIGVILDWVPAHFPKDEHGLINFDGKCCYENQGWDRIEHKQWGTRRFDYGRTEVQSFLISSAMFFFDKFHIDGIRVDAVASMLYLDYDKKPNEWIPNVYGNNENLEAIAFIRKLNKVIFGEYPNALMIAEESTAWPLVTKPTNIGGLGFNFKWNIGWMNDTLEYISTDSFFRKDIHDKLTFSMFYAFSENYILPISHDEVVHGKKSLLDKMWGTYDQKFDLMRTFLSYMIAHPGKKLNFMGSEFGQFKEWDNSMGLDFMLLQYDKHKAMLDYVRELNWLYLSTPELYEVDSSWDGFRWIIPDDKSNNVVAFARYNKAGDELIFVANFSPNDYTSYKVGVRAGTYDIVFNTAEKSFGGTGCTKKVYKSTKTPMHGSDSSIDLHLSPLSAYFIRRRKTAIKLDKENKYYGNKKIKRKQKN